VTNCILWGDGPNELTDYSSTSTVLFSDVQGGFPGAGNIDLDPMLTRAPDPGPDAAWGTIDDDHGDFRQRRFLLVSTLVTTRGFRRVSRSTAPATRGSWTIR